MISRAKPPTSAHSYQFDADLDWSSETTVTVFLTVPPPAPPQDTSAPTVTSARVTPEGTQIRIFFNERMDPSNRPEFLNVFEVTADGVPLTFDVLETGIGTGGVRIQLSGLSRKIRGGETVVVSYTDPTPHGNNAYAIHDLAGKRRGVVHDRPERRPEGGQQLGLRPTAVSRAGPAVDLR